MSRRYLIINADDFGICQETNEAIEHLFNEERITSTTVITPANASLDAIDRAKNNKKIKMGLHITLNSDHPYDRWDSIAPALEVSSLLDEEGKFHHELSRFYSRAKDNEVAIEINAQYDYVASQGYKPTHADSHCGTLYGLTGKPFIKEAFELCARHGLPFRLPKSKDFMIERFRGQVPPEIEAMHSQAISAAGKMGIALPDDIITSPFGVKDIKAYENLKAFYINIIRNLKEGVTELFLHPSKENRMFMSHNPEWQKRIWEYQFLLDDDMLKAIEQEGVSLVGWTDAPFKSV